MVQEAYVPRDINEAEFMTLGHFGIGEAGLDGQPACFFLFQPVGIDTGETLDEAGLAMVDVAGGTDDQGVSPLF